MVFENHETFFDVWHRILFVSFHACIMLFLFDDAVVILLVEGTKRSVYLRESPKMVEEPRIEIVR